MSASGPAGRDVVFTAAVVVVELSPDLLLVLPLEQPATASAATAAVIATVVRTRVIVRPGRTVRISTPPGRTDGSHGGATAPPSLRARCGMVCQDRQRLSGRA